jgi:hypothetical protein
MRDFYRAANGLEDGDDRNFDFCALSELHRAPRVRSMLLFADVNQYTWDYGIEVDGATPYKKGAVYAVSNDPVEIAPSLSAFYVKPHGGSDRTLGVE